MTTRSTIITVIVGILILAAGAVWFRERPTTSDGTVVNETPVQQATTTPSEKDNLIRVDSVSVNQIITSPLKVSGTARGTWYFEASFPVELVDGNGKRLAAMPAQAQGEWMTEDFVPFSVTIPFTTPTTATGTLILHKDNPSGDPIRDDALRIPVRFR